MSAKMKHQSLQRRSIADVAIALAGITMGWLYMAVEPALSAAIFHDGNLVRQIVASPRQEIWMRGLFAGVIILFGIFAQLTFSKNRRAEQKIRGLYQQEKELRQAVQAETKKRAEFTRTLVHELKTPLTSLLASSEMLASELQQEPWLSLVRNIYRGASDLNGRIDELLDIARGELGMLRVDLKPVDPRQLLQEVAADVAPVVASRQQSLTLNLPSSLPLIQADGSRTRQVLLNLLNNASKFTPEGGKITLAAGKKNHSLIVEVQDTGPGIAEEDQKRLFEPYYRVEANGQRAKGLGLGLALCKKLVELHRGQIWVESRVGEGATFSFSVPLEATTNT